MCVFVCVAGCVCVCACVCVCVGKLGKHSHQTTPGAPVQHRPRQGGEGAESFPVSTTRHIGKRLPLYLRA